MDSKASQEDIQLYLKRLNEVWDSLNLSPDTAEIRAGSLQRLRKWFRYHGIAIRRDRNNEWKLAEEVRKDGDCLPNS